MQIQKKTPLEEARRTLSKIDLGFKTWSHLSLKSRIKMIRRLRKAVSKNTRKIAGAISEECGRPLMEALSQEVLPVLEMAKYCERKFPKWLSRRRLPYRRPGFWRKKNYLFYEPIGPVAVFSPQNFPFSLGMMTLIYATLAGNTVVLKPSERSTLVPSVIEDLLRDSGLLASGATSILTGDTKTGKWLVKHPKIKKIFFFGQRPSGMDVANACMRHLKPFVLEMGGGSTAFVCADADIEQAATGLAWSSFYTYGQSCVSTERIIVDKEISEKFIFLFKEKVTHFQREMMDNAKKGKNDLSRTSRLNELIEDARAKGAEVFRARMPQSQENNGFFNFTVISNASDSMRVSKEEIFGPVVVVQTVSNLKEAIVKMNKNLEPMSVSIWSRNHKQAYHLAKKMPTAMIWINDSSFGLPNLPWGGLGKTGWGKLFSELSIQEVTRQKWISKHPSRFSRKRFWWNPYTLNKEKLLIKIAENFF